MIQALSGFQFNSHTISWIVILVIAYLVVRKIYRVLSYIGGSRKSRVCPRCGGSGVDSNMTNYKAGYISNSCGKCNSTGWYTGW